MITVISPLYNEEAGIRTAVESMLAKLRTLTEPWEYILVNDGSTDGSLGIIEELARKHKELRIVSYPVNRGRGRALREGFAAARGDIIITTEADSSWGENIVFEFLEKFRQEPELDMIIASTHKPGGGYKNVPWHRVMYSYWGNKILSLSVFGKLTMLSGMCRAYRRAVIDALVLDNDGKEIHLEIVSKALALKFRIGEIPAMLEWKKAIGDRTKKRKSTFNPRRLIVSHLLFSFVESPVLLIGGAGLIFIVAGLAVGLFILAEYLRGTLNPDRPLLFLMAVLLIVGVQTLLFSFTAYQNKLTQNELYKLQSDLKRLGRDRPPVV